jgi:hypothetical protein
MFVRQRTHLLIYDADIQVHIVPLHAILFIASNPRNPLPIISSSPLTKRAAG